MNPENMPNPVEFSCVFAVTSNLLFISGTYKNVRIFTVAVLTMSGWGVYKPDH